MTNCIPCVVGLGHLEKTIKIYLKHYNKIYTINES